MNRINRFLVSLSKVGIKSQVVLIVLFSIWLFFASAYARQGDLFFHSDVARDYLVLADMVHTHRPTLIGPRAGGVAGYFHGPLWFYLNLPAFMVFHGNPSSMAWWYIFLVVVNIAIVFFVSKRLFSLSTALIATLLFSLISLSYPLNMFNPYGAVLFSPLFFYWWCVYDRTKRQRFLTLSIFISGLLIQFQIAFGAPMLVLLFLALLNEIRKSGKWKHLTSLLILVIPLSTYILFDIRHDWLQLRALLSLVHSNGQDNGSALHTFIEKLALMIGPSISLVSYMYSPGFLVGVINVISILLIGIAYAKNLGEHKKVVGWFLYFYFGFWFLTFFYHGEILSYYYWPFVPITTIIAATGFTAKKSYPVIFLFSSLFILNIFVESQLVQQVHGFVGERDLSWKFYSKVARDTFSSGDSEFGYFIYTPDLYGYQPTYAMNFISKSYPTKKSFSFQKKHQTFLIMAPAPTDRPQFTSEHWKKDQVKITSEPIHVTQYSNGYVVEEYKLTDQDIAINPDPNLVQGLFFR